MEALKLHKPDPTPSDNRRPGARWLDLPDAATRTGWTVGHLRRRCLEAWEASGHARKVKNAAGHNAWQVREDADPALAPVKTVEQLDDKFDLRQLKQKHRDRLLQRKRILMDWEQVRAAAVKLGFTEQQATGQFLARIAVTENRKLSRATLFNWLRDYRANGLMGLCNKTWLPTDHGTQTTDHDFFAELKHWYLLPRKMSKQLAYDHAVEKAQEHGWPIPTYRTACRFLKTIPARELALHRGGDAEYNAARSYIERDYTTIASNDIWCGDHHIFDVLVQDGKGGFARPWLTGWEDVRSRKIVGWTISLDDPNATRILDAFRRGCQSHGVPKEVYIDNGKDYDSKTLQTVTKRQRRRGIKPVANVPIGIFTRLDIEVTHANPHAPQGKMIERLFGTVCGRFSKRWDTYCGNKPQNKPANLQQQLDAGRAPTLAEFIEAFENWLIADYHARPHAGHAMDGRGPAEVFEAELKIKRTAPEGLLDLLTLKQVAAKVRPNGVRYQGLDFGRDLPALVQLQGKAVHLLIDDRDLSQVQVYTTQGQFVCLAKLNQRLPFHVDDQTLRDSIADQKRQKREVKKYHEKIRPRLNDTPADSLRRAAAERKKQMSTANRQPPTPTIKPIQTPFTEQFPALQKAMERQRLKIAAGGEAGVPDLLEAARNLHQNTAAGGSFSLLSALGQHDSSADQESDDPMAAILKLAEGDDE